MAYSLNICSLFNIVIDNVKFRFVESNFLISLVIEVIASSVRAALPRTSSIFLNRAARSALAVDIRSRESALVAVCVARSWEIS